MIHWQSDIVFYLHREPVDFRKSINGLSVIVEEAMALDVFARSCFVFCNKQRNKLKVLYWDNTGFCLWYKRLERDQFKWPRRHADEVIALSYEQYDWLLRGLDLSALTPHKNLHYHGIK